MKKITLKRTTVRNLSDSVLVGAAGGTIFDPPQVLTKGCTGDLSVADRCETAMQCATRRCPVSLNNCPSFTCPTIP